MEQIGREGEIDDAYLEHMLGSCSLNKAIFPLLLQKTGSRI